MTARLPLSRQILAVDKARELLSSQNAKRFGMTEHDLRYFIDGLIAGHASLQFIERNESEFRAFYAANRKSEAE